MKDQRMKQIRLFVLALASTVAVELASGASIHEDFATDPAQRGWQTFGDTHLFTWNQAGHLDVTWDSSKPNSFFWHPLGTIVSRDDDFDFTFDLRLEDIGASGDYAGSFQLAAGLLNVDQARQPGFLRGSGFDSPNIVEVAYFRADEFGSPDTVFPTVISSNMVFNFNPGQQNSTNHTLPLNTWHRVHLGYDAESQTLHLAITNLSTLEVVEVVQPLNASFTDFRVGTFSINSYNDAGQFPGFEGSILAHGSIDNIHVTSPAPPVSELRVAAYPNAAVSFLGRAGFKYTLEKATDLSVWTAASVTVDGQAEVITLEDQSPDDGNAFYRVRAERP